MALMDLKVDATLLKTAQTKGAISDSEMKLFQQPTPSIDDQETVWIEWIKKRQEALRKVRERLAGGTTVDQPASAAQVVCQPNDWRKHKRSGRYSSRIIHHGR